MNTAFGQFLQKDFFKKFFSVSVLLSAVICAFMNVYAINTQFHHHWLSCFIGILYILMGCSTLIQNQIMEKRRSKRLETFIGIYSCFFIYNFMILLLWLIFSILFPVSGQTQAIGILILDLFSAIIVLMGYLHAKQIKYTSYSIPLGINGNTCRIAMISDIHLGVFVGEKHIQNMVSRINSLQPDLVLICGDIIDVNNHILDDDNMLQKISSILQKIETKEGVFAVLGNHDPKVTNQKFIHFLKASHIRLLHNETVRLSFLNLIGRTDAGNNDRSSMESLLKKASPSLPAILLDHNPSGIPEACKFGIDLVLSGHTHRGQFIPVTYFTKLANGKHYFYGYEQFGKTQAVISSGVGFFQLPVRIGTSNEIVDIHIT